MHRRRLIAVYIAILAAWMQVLAPVAMAASRPGDDPFSIICAHHSTGSDDGSQPAEQHGKAHHCCLLCHAQLGGPAPDDRPVFTTFDYPIASPLRWRLVTAPSTAEPQFRQHRPRGPPSLV